MNIKFDVHQSERCAICLCERNIIFMSNPDIQIRHIFFSQVSFHLKQSCSSTMKHLNMDNSSS